MGMVLRRLWKNNNSNYNNDTSRVNPDSRQFVCSLLPAGQVGSLCQMGKSILTPQLTVGPEPLKIKRDTSPLLPNTCIPSCDLDPPTATLILQPPKEGASSEHMIFFSASISEKLISRSNE